MAPFSMRCNTCGEYVYAGKKFNGRKEVVQGESYYGIKIFRFYIKCPQCSAEITFKTDPRNADYTVEHGVSRNFEPWREAREDAEEGDDGDPLAHLLKEDGIDVDGDDDEDPMKALEKRMEESKREMEIMDALQDIRTRNARNERVGDTDEVLARLEAKKRERDLLKGPSPEELERMRQEEEDEILVRKHFGRDLAAAEASTSDAEQTPQSEQEGAHGSPAVETRGPSAKPLTIKRARSDEEADDEPDVTALLSERARAHLMPAAAASTSSSAMASKVKAGLGPSSASKKKKANAFGLVRKKT